MLCGALLPVPAVQGVDCELMMETSGHGAMRSNHYLDDGSHLALTAVVAFVRSRLLHGGALRCAHCAMHRCDALR